MLGKESDDKQRLFELLIHDLTGPLAVISASTTSLLRKLDRDRSLTDREQSTLDRILRNTRRSQLIIGEMIELLRSEAGLFRKESFPVEGALRESILASLDVDAGRDVDEAARHQSMPEFLAMLESHGIFVRISGRYASAAFHHDLRKVQQIVQNLLSNALKHRRHRVDVKISGETNLVVSVEDDGGGIAEKDRESVFQRFVRLKAEDDPSRPGLGLGLAGVRALVQAMGGQITFVSQEGVGTKFSVSLPPLE